MAGNVSGRSVIPAAALAINLALQACGPSGAAPEGVAFDVVRAYEGGGARIELSLESESMTTAESALLRLEVECDESASVEFPDSQDGFGEFAVARDDPLPDRLLDSGRVVRGREYVLQPFLAGDYVLPALEIVVGGKGTVSTEEIPVDVASVLADPQAAELQDTIEPVDIPVPWWWWACGGLAAGLAAALSAWWWKRRRERLAAPRVVLPHEAALAALESLLAENLLADGDFKGFYLRLSDIVRHYIEERFGLRAPEQTTEEFLAALASSAKVRVDHKALLRGFLEQADIVKFAKHVPPAREVSGAVDAARQFIRQTEPEDPIAGAARKS